MTPRIRVRRVGVYLWDLSSSFSLVRSRSDGNPKAESCVKTSLFPFCSILYCQMNSSFSVNFRLKETLSPWKRSIFLRPGKRSYSNGSVKIDGPLRWSLMCPFTRDMITAAPYSYPPGMDILSQECGHCPGSVPFRSSLWPRDDAR